MPLKSENNRLQANPKTFKSNSVTNPYSVFPFIVVLFLIIILYYNPGNNFTALRVFEFWPTADHQGKMFDILGPGYWNIVQIQEFFKCQRGPNICKTFSRVNF